MIKIPRTQTRPLILLSFAVILLAGWTGRAATQSTVTVAAPPAGVEEPFVTASQGAGFSPGAPLLQAGDGTFYGTCAGETISAGGQKGTVFHMDSGGNITVLATFSGDNGMSPGGALVFGTDGNLYGTTVYGGIGYDGSGYSGNGTAFMVVPNGASSVLTTLWAFTTGTDGSNPSGSLVPGQDGNFYGTASQGGQDNDGILYKLVPNGANSTLSALWTFSGDADGAGPGALLSASNGIFYGLTFSDGPGGFGTVFKLDTTGAQPSLTTIAAFNGINGASPSSLIMGPHGILYGVTSGGGPRGYGTIFELTPTGVLTTLVVFDGANGAEPNGLLFASDGNFYGTTSVGGARNGGTFFRLTLPKRLSVLHSFNPVTGELWSVGGMIEGMDHSFYGGDAVAGAIKGGGSIFALIPGRGAPKVVDLVDFTPPSTIPSCAAVRAITVTKNQATVLGIVNPNGNDTTAKFELSTDGHSQAGHLVNAVTSTTVDLGSGTKGILVKATFTGLQQSTTYYFQFDADSNVGHDGSGGPSFSTPGPPTIVYGSPSSVSSQSETISGAVNPRAHKSVAYFQYGPSLTYGQSSPKTTIGVGINAAPLSFTINGLSPGTEYHYRIVAQSSLGKVFGPDQVFVTAQ